MRNFGHTLALPLHVMTFSLAISRLADQGLQSFQIRGSGKHLVADGKSRRSIDPERAGEIEVPLQHRLDRRGLCFGFQAVDIEPRRRGCFEHLGLVDGTADLHQRVVQGEVFALLVCRQGYLGCKRRVRAEDREFLEDKAQLRIGRLRLEHQWRHLPAIGTVVVEEFDKRDIAVRISSDRAIGVAKYFVGARLQDRLRFRRLLGALSRLESIDRLDDDLGVIEKECAHAPFEFVFRHVGGHASAAVPRSESGIECEPCTDHAKQNQRNEQPADEPWGTLESRLWGQLVHRDLPFYVSEPCRSAGGGRRKNPPHDQNHPLMRSHRLGLGWACGFSTSLTSAFTNTTRLLGSNFNPWKFARQRPSLSITCVTMPWV